MKVYNMGYVARRYFKDLSKATNHIGYIAYRSRESDIEEKGLFNDKEDQIDSKAFIQNLDCKLTSHSTVPVAHTLLFSMSGDEFNRSGFEYGDYKSLVRNVIQKYELEKGIKLEWAAAEHFKETHPHCHVVIKSTFKDRDGVEHRLTLSKEDVEWFKNSFELEKDQMRGFTKEHLLRQKHLELKRNRPNGMPKRTSRGTQLLDALIYQIKRKAQEKEHDYERGM